MIERLRQSIARRLFMLGVRKLFEAGCVVVLDDYSITVELPLTSTQVDRIERWCEVSRVPVVVEDEPAPLTN